MIWWNAMFLSQDFVGSREDVSGDDAETAVAIVNQPIVGMAAEGGDPVCKQHVERLLQLQRKNVVRQTHVTSGLARGGGRYGPVFVRKFRMRHPPMMTAVARQDRVPRMRVNRALRRSHN